VAGENTGNNSILVADINVNDNLIMSLISNANNDSFNLTTTSNNETSAEIELLESLKQIEIFKDFVNSTEGNKSDDLTVLEGVAVTDKMDKSSFSAMELDEEEGSGQMDDSVVIADEKQQRNESGGLDTRLILKQQVSGRVADVGGAGEAVLSTTTVVAVTESTRVLLNQTEVNVVAVGESTLK
jgi:hypothetical protein